jgi:hypothetical protein
MPTITRNPDGSVKTINGVDINSISSNNTPNNLTTSWPSATADPLKFNAQQFISDMANIAGSDDWDGFVRNEPLYLDEYPVNLDYYAGSGDPRYPMNVAMKDMYDEFLPRQAAYQEVVEAGGCQIINEYICDSDGNPILKVSEQCKTTTNISIIQSEEIINFVNNSFANAVKEESDSFINYLKINYINNGWNIQLFDVSMLYLFLIKITKQNNSNFYIKYFYDQKDYVSSVLNIPLIISEMDDNFLDSTDNPLDFLKYMQSGSPVFNQS